MGLNHIYMGDSHDVIIDMIFYLQWKFKVDGKLFIDRDKFIIVGLKLIREDTSLEMMNSEMVNMMRYLLIVNFIIGN